MENILKDSNIVNQILNKLSEVSVIPDHGFLAGGAVANTLLDIKYGDTKYPINDLDIYIEADSELTSSRTPLRSNELVIINGYYNNSIGYKNGTSYRIQKVSRDNMLNWITISKINQNNETKFRYILEGFDLNCCQVGIDLVSNKLFYTEEFESFLNNKQLEVTSIYTPPHTAIRLLKKKKELNCYCDVDKCMELLSQPLIPTNTFRSGNNYGIYFSKKYKDLFIKYYGELKDYFKLVNFFDHKKILWDKQRAFVNNQTNEDLPNDHIVRWLDPKNSIPPNLLSNWSQYTDIMWSLIPIKYVETNSNISFIYEGITPEPAILMNTYNLINGKTKKSKIKKAKIVIDNGNTNVKLLCIANKDFYDCDFTKEHIIKLNQSVEGRMNEMLCVLMKFKTNVQESLSLIKDIEKISRKEGDWITSVLFDILIKTNSMIKPKYEKMVLWLEDKKKEMSKPLIKPLSLDNIEKEIKNVTIFELVNEFQIEWAGKKLRNCLNNPGQGYVDKIMSGVVKVFIIKTNKSISALELKLDKSNLYFSEVQLLSTCNKKPSLYHRVISDILISKINSLQLNKQSEIMKKHYEDIILLNKGLLVTTKDETTENNQTASFNGFELEEDEIELDWEEDEMVNIYDGFNPNRPRRPNRPNNVGLLENIYGRRGNIIGQQLVREENVNPNPITEEVEERILFSDYLHRNLRG